MEQDAAVLIDTAVLFEDSTNSVFVVIAVSPSCRLENFNNIGSHDRLLILIELMTNHNPGCDLQLIDLFISQFIDYS